MLYAIAAVLVIIIDQWVKYVVSGAIPVSSAGETFIPGFLSLVNVQNDGVAFGFLSGGGATTYLIILAGVFTVAVIIALATNFVSNRLARWSLVLMTAGGIANCIDRIMSGFVQDMFKFDISFLRWFPVFNVADVFITVFCFFFVLAIIFGRDDEGYEDEFDEEDDEEEDRPRRQPKEPKEPKPAKPSRRARQAKYEDDYEQYKANRAARQKAEAQAAQEAAPAAPVKKAPAPTTVQNPSDPFAEWEKASAAAGKPAYGPAGEEKVKTYEPKTKQPQVQPAPAQPRPAAAQPKPAPKASADEFDLEDILAEFK